MALDRFVAGICVGIDKPGLLPPLQDAARSASRFNDWLLSQQGFGAQVQSQLLTDENEPVTRRQVLDAVSKVVADRACDVLFLYLSGHGVAHTAYEEKFLLSDVARDDTEAINLRPTIERAKRCGLPHVVIVYDACRSVANTEKLRQIAGGPVFPSGSVTKRGEPVDTFFACAPDESAFEVAAAGGPQPKAHEAFFTNVLLGTLDDPPEPIVQTTTLSNQPVRVIPSATLEALLEAEIPKLAAAQTEPFDQHPDIEAPSHLPPRFFALAPPPKLRAGAPPGDKPLRRPAPERPPIRGAAPKPAPAAGRPATGGLADLMQWVAGGDFGRVADVAAAVPPPLHSIADRSGFSSAAKKVAQAIGREGFETNTGFTVIGARVTRVDVAGDLPARLEFDRQQADAVDIRIGDSPKDVRGGTALIEFDDGGGVAAGILPGFVGTLVVNRGRIEVLAYTPARRNAAFSDYANERKTVEARRAIATAAVTTGKLEKLGRTLGRKLAGLLRVQKSVDPGLGVLAAYAYFLADDRQQVASVHRWMSTVRVPPFGTPARNLAPVPFDVAMLAGKLTRRTAWDPPGIAPCCPMLSLGWSLLELFELDLHPAIIEAARYRRASTWSCFEARGLDVLRRAMKEGVLR
jgi:hypothetical protein